MENLKAWFKANGFTTVKAGAEKLTAELGISVKEYEEDDLFVFNYSQIDSPKTHPVVIECRGLITDNNFNPVCRPFNRFFNIGEAPECTEGFDFNNAEFFEKADGSLVKVYYHKGHWNVATRGTAFAESENYTGETFASLILEAFGCKDFYDFQMKMLKVPKKFTHVFEYTSPKNRVVTPYSESCMVLLGVRDTETGDELSGAGDINEIACNLVSYGLNVRPAKSYVFKTKEEMLEAVQNLPGLQEGFVCFSNGIRVKVKSELYVQVHRLRGETVPTPKRIAELVVTNEVDEYLTYFKEDTEMFEPYREAFDSMIKEAHGLFRIANREEEQKAFALLVKDTCYSGPLFSARKKSTSFVKEFMNMGIPVRTKILLNYKESVK